MRFLQILFWLFVILLVVTFTVLNAHTVTFDYYTGNIQIFLPLLLVLTLFVGILIGVMLMIPALIRTKHRFHKSESALKKAEQEIQNLRTIPIDDRH